jgi:hypothetical protein
MFNIQLGRLIIASIVAGIMGISGYMMLPALVSPVTDMRIEPESGVAIVGSTFTIDIVVSSAVPVNVFKGSLIFSPEFLYIEDIEYNTSIADLWAELPWYSNGDGTMNFIGGTTKPGGFVGEGTLISVTFKTKAVGQATISMDEVRVLKHDGLGNDAEIGQPIDAIFTVESEQLQNETVLQKTYAGPTVIVLPELPSTDLNGDGKQTILDVSIFMADLATQNSQSDFNQDGVVNLKDLSILNN